MKSPAANRLLAILHCLIAVLAAASSGCSTDGMPPFAAHCAHGAVAADHETASKAGADMLRLGGNAVDAAVATSFTLSVVRPESCGIGGGGFMVIHFSNEGIRDQKAHGRDVPQNVALNYREMCPWGIGPDFYETESGPYASTRGGKSVAIPGTVAGLLTALDKYGTLDRKTILAPAIRAAEEGFAADKHFVDAAMDVAKDFEKNPGWKDRFRFVWVRMCREGNVKVGDLIRLPEQASALRLIAEQGAAAFYQGPIAQAMVAAIQRDTGALTQEDLNRFQVASMEPLKFQAFGKTFVTMPPPSSGGVAMVEAMGILELIMPLDAHDFMHKRRRGKAEANDWGRGFREAAALTPYATDSGSAWFSHRLIEALKHAFADRAEWMGDPTFVDVPTSRLTSRTYISDLASRFDRSRTLTPDAYGTRRQSSQLKVPDDHGTSHLSVVDGLGNAVACTETINQGFGSCLAVDAFGFILNDQMDDFTTRRGTANGFNLTQSDRNLPAPGKRPLSSMTPTIALDGHDNVDLVVGASGGPRIISGTLQAILNCVIWDKPAWDAVSAVRLHHQWSPDVVMLENGVFDDSKESKSSGISGDTLVDQLQSLGHRVQKTDAIGNVQLIARDSNGGWQAACDPRKGGKPAGY